MALTADNRAVSFLLFCAGANQDIIRAIPGTSGNEIHKFIGVGLSVIFTALFASISAAFALNTFVDNIWACLGIGLLWGTMIFNLDRYIVSTMRKEDNSWKELANATPRIVIALLFAFVISRPLELELFRSEIEVKLPDVASQQTDFYRVQIDSLKSENNRLKAESLELRDPSAQDRFVASKKTLLDQEKVVFNRMKTNNDQQIRELNSQISIRQNLISNLGIGPLATKRKQLRAQLESIDSTGTLNETEIQDEIASLTSQIRALVPTRTAFENEINEFRRQVASYNQQTAKQDSLVRVREQDYRDAIEDADNAIRRQIAYNDSAFAKNDQEIARLGARREAGKAQFDGLLARIATLEALKKKDTTMWWVSNLVFLLFLAIETAPIFTKIITKKTSYDEVLEDLQKKDVDSFEKPLPVDFDGLTKDQKEEVLEKQNELSYTAWDNYYMLKVQPLREANDRLKKKVKEYQDKLEAEQKKYDQKLKQREQRSRANASDGAVRSFPEEKKSAANTFDENIEEQPVRKVGYWANIKKDPVQLTIMIFIFLGVSGVITLIAMSITGIGVSSANGQEEIAGTIDSTQIAQAGTGGIGAIDSLQRQTVGQDSLSFTFQPEEPAEEDISSPPQGSTSPPRNPQPEPIISPPTDTDGEDSDLEPTPTEVDEGDSTIVEGDADDTVSEEPLAIPSDSIPPAQVDPVVNPVDSPNQVPSPNVAQPEPTPVPNTPQRLVISKGFGKAKLLAEAMLGADVVTRIPRNTELTILNSTTRATKRFYQVAYEGQTGWLLEDDVSLIE